MINGGKVRRNEGAALMLTLGYLAAITLFATAFLTSLHRTMDRSNKGYRSQQCMAIAEGGLDKAVAELRRKADAYTGEQDTPLGNGAFSVEVSKVEGLGGYRIVSSGELRHGGVVLARARIEAEARLAPGSGPVEVQWQEVHRK